MNEILRNTKTSDKRTDRERRRSTGGGWVVEEEIVGWGRVKAWGLGGWGGDGGLVGGPTQGNG